MAVVSPARSRWRRPGRPAAGNATSTGRSRAEEGAAQRGRLRGGSPRLACCEADGKGESAALRPAGAKFRSCPAGSRGRSGGRGVGSYERSAPASPLLRLWEDGPVPAAVRVGPGRGAGGSGRVTSEPTAARPALRCPPAPSARRGEL